MKLGPFGTGKKSRLRLLRSAAFYRTNNRILRVHTHISDVIRSTDYVRDMGQLEIHGAELGGLDCTTMQIARINE